MKRSLAVLSVLAVLCLTILPVRSKDAIKPQESVSIHLTLGNPSDADDREDNFLMVKVQYALSYNNSNGGPNWVSWHLEKRDLGRQDRANDFRPDDSLPDDFTHVTYDDYGATGFDSGHLCNSKDRTNNRRNNSATFLMTNMLPQAPSLNRGPWKSLESFEQKEATEGRELYIVAGGFGTGGTGFVKPRNKPGRLVRATKIAGGKVNVPKTFWKVLVILPRGEDDLDRVNANTRTIAVCMPNSQSVRGKNWRTFITTIRNVERATGYDFLSEVSSSLQNAIETRRDSLATGPANRNPCQ
jgi:endonuclease G